MPLLAEAFRRGHWRPSTGHQERASSGREPREEARRSATKRFTGRWNGV